MPAQRSSCLHLRNPGRHDAVVMRRGLNTFDAFSAPRLVPIGVRPIAALAVTAVYGAMLVQLPAPAPVAVSLTPAEVMILPPGDPRQELAAAGSPESAAAQASDGLESASVAEPAELPPAEELAPVKPPAEPVRTVEAVEAAASPAPALQAEPPLEAVETAVAISPRELEPTDPNDLAPATAVPAKRETVTTKEVERPKEKQEREKEQKKERKKEPAKRASASSSARRGQAGSGGGQRNASAQSIAAYASHVRSVLVSRTQRIRNLRSTGRVGLTFTINAGGRLASMSLRSSGSAEIDRAVRAALRGVSFPPPPNGRFSGNITITIR